VSGAATRALAGSRGGGEQVLAGVLFADPGAVDAGPGGQPVGDAWGAGEAQQQRRGQQRQRGAAALSAPRPRDQCASRHVPGEPADQGGRRIVGGDARERVGGAQAPVKAGVVAGRVDRGTGARPTGWRVVVWGGVASGRFAHAGVATTGWMSDRQGKLVEGDCQPPLHRLLDCQLVVPAANVLDEGVSGDHDPGAVLLPEPAHRS
jgi:hypothetical protein